MTKLSHQGHILRIHLRLVVHHRRKWRWSINDFLQPFTRPFLFAVDGNVTGAAAQRTDDCVGDDGLCFLKLLQFSKSVVFPQGSIEQSEFTQLLFTQIILGVRHRDSFHDDLLYLVRGLLDVFCNARCDVGVQWFVLRRQRSSILVSHLTLLHGTLSTDDYCGASLLLDVPERVAARSNQ